MFSRDKKLKIIILLSAIIILGSIFGYYNYKNKKNINLPIKTTAVKTHDSNNPNVILYAATDGTDDGNGTWSAGTFNGLAPLNSVDLKAEFNFNIVENNISSFHFTCADNKTAEIIVPVSQVKIIKSGTVIVNTNICSYPEAGKYSASVKIMKRADPLKNNKEIPWLYDSINIVARPKPTEIITIDANGGVEKPSLIGFLHGIPNDNPALPKPELVSALKMKFWRGGGSFAGDPLKLYPLIKQFNPKITWDTSSYYYAAVNKWYNECGPNFQGCTPKDCETKFPPQPWEDKYKLYKQTIRDVVKKSIELNFPIDYWDWWSEPENYGRFGTQEQMFGTYKVFSDTMRELEKETGKKLKIVAPSIGSQGSDYQDDNDCNLPPKPENKKTFDPLAFLNYVKENNLKLDAFSWHPMDFPDLVPNEVIFVRNYMHKIGLCDPRCPEIHINEHQGWEQSLLPGNTLGWMYNLEKSNPEWVSRSCWTIQGVNGCWGGFDSMFMQDTKTPQALYWVYSAYAKMDGKLRLPIATTDSHTVALASNNREKKEINILAGRYCHNGNRDHMSCYYPLLRVGPDAIVRITLKNYSYRNSPQIFVYKIPHNNNIPAPLPNPLLISSYIISSDKDKINIDIPNFRDEDAYELLIKEQ